MDPNSMPSTPPVQAPVIPELPKQPEKLLPAPHHTSWGAFIGIIIILMVLIVGALYFWGAKLADRDSTSLTPETTLSEESRVEAIP